MDPGVNQAQAQFPAGVAGAWEREGDDPVPYRSTTTRPAPPTSNNPFQDAPSPKAKAPASSAAASTSAVPLDTFAGPSATSSSQSLIPSSQIPNDMPI